MLISNIFINVVYKKVSSSFGTWIIYVKLVYRNGKRNQLASENKLTSIAVVEQITI